MHRTRMFALRRLGTLALAALVLAGNWLGATVEPAQAAFPGRNGKIAFVSTRTTGRGVDNPEGDTEIFAMNPDGTGVKQLTRNTASEANPAWSRDGKKIAFASNRDGNYEVYTMNADGGSPTRRTSAAGTDLGPAWSPDGKKIAFWSDRGGGNFDVYMMSTNGGNQTRRTSNEAQDQEPDWQRKPR